MEGIHFQEEILVDILSKLHMRSLLRFKCVSKYWSTLIARAYVKMKGRLSFEERVESTVNLYCYVFRLQEGFFKDKKAEFKEILDKYPLSENERKLLGYDSGSDVHPSEDDNTEDEGSSAEEYDSEEVDDAESDDESDNDEDDDGGGGDDGDDDDDDDDDDADDVKKGELSAEQIGDLDKILCHMCYSVFLLEKFYKDRKADLKEIQDKYPLSRHARQLLGYDSWSDHPSEVDNTKDDRTAVEEHDNEEVNTSESSDGSDDGDHADEDTFDSAGIVA